MSEEAKLPNKRKAAVETLEELETVIVSVPVKDANGMVQGYVEKEVPLADAAPITIPGGLGGQRKY